MGCNNRPRSPPRVMTYLRYTPRALANRIWRARLAT